VTPPTTDQAVGPAPTARARPKLLAVIATRPLDDDRFQAAPHGDWLGAFAHGGLAAAQALWSAAATVGDGYLAHSIRASFLGVGRSADPMDVVVERLRDGRSFATRLVRVSQLGRLLLHLVASFHRDEQGAEYQLAIDDAVPSPESLPPSSHPLMQRLRSLRDVDVREIGPTRPRVDGTYRATRRAWVRVDAALPDDPLIHACAFTVMSDIGTVNAARHPIMRGVSWQSVGAASLDHSMWFHRTIRADAWALYELRTVSAQGARSLVHGSLHSRDGRLGISLAQEVLLRPPSRAHPR
jgi:acyl-CoA thioesterase II